VLKVKKRPQRVDTKKLEFCRNTVELSVLLLTEKMVKKTGLSEVMCREMVIRDLEKRKSLAVPA
jgi:hypothetical protein